MQSSTQRWGLRGPGVLLGETVRQTQCCPQAGLARQSDEDSRCWEGCGYPTHPQCRAFLFFPERVRFRTKPLSHRSRKPQCFIDKNTLLPPLTTWPLEVVRAPPGERTASTRTAVAGGAQLPLHVRTPHPMARPAGLWGEMSRLETSPRCWVPPEGGLPLLGRARSGLRGDTEARPPPTSLPRSRGHGFSKPSLLMQQLPHSHQLCVLSHIHFPIHYPALSIRLQCILVFILCSNGPRFGHGKAHRVGACVLLFLILTHGYFFQ